MKKIKKVSVIGLGYVGLPLFVAINKSKKYKVNGYEIDKKKVDLIQTGVSPINDEDVSTYIKSTKVDVSNDKNNLKNSDVFIICVPTPIYDDFDPDYGPVIAATELISDFLKKDDHFVLESTVNPGTCDEIVIPILEQKTGLKAGRDFNVAHCPERINPGDKKWNVYNIPRNIGSINQKYNEQIADFYRSFINADINEVENLKIAEATKIVENTFRDINIAYVNELAQSFDSMGVDLFQTLKAASNKPFGFMPHWPGCGVGGHCIAVDPYYLIKQASKSGFNHRFLKLAREINNSMPKYTVNKLITGLNELGLSLKNTKIALLGLSYKADVGDLRESPALEIEKLLIKGGADLLVYDPYIDRAEHNLKKVVKEATAILIATAHQEIIEKIIALLPNSSVKLLIDGRNCLDKKSIKKLGIDYHGIGH